MKKYLSLFVLSILFFTGCTTIGSRYRSTGRHYWNRQDPLVETEQDLEGIANKYRITISVKIAVIGNNQQVVEDAKEVFDDFGFKIVQDNYEGDVDYVIRVERENRARGYSGYYGFGYSGRQKNIVKAKLTLFDDAAGIEYRYDGMQEYRYRNYYWGYYHHSSSYQSDPGYIAFKGALMEAIGEFIQASSIPHHWPKKK